MLEIKLLFFCFNWIDVYWEYFISIKQLFGGIFINTIEISRAHFVLVTQFCLGWHKSTYHSMMKIRSWKVNRVKFLKSNFWKYFIIDFGYMWIQACLREIESFFQTSTEQNITIKPFMQMFGFLMHIKVMFTVYWSLLSTQQHYIF